MGERVAGSGGAEPSDAPPREGDRSLTLEQAAVRHGAYRWVEHRLFELTGSWAAAPGMPDAARVHLFEASAQHAWHAQLWSERLPVLAGFDRERLSEPSGPAPAMLAALDRPGIGAAATAGGEATPDVAARRFLVGLGRVVLPLLLTSYRGFARRLVPVSDGPSIRALALVVRDEEEELVATEVLLDAAIEGFKAEQEAAEWTRSIGKPVLQGGGNGDLVPWPEGDLRGSGSLPDGAT